MEGGGRWSVMVGAKLVVVGRCGRWFVVGGWGIDWGIGNGRKV